MKAFIFSKRFLIPFFVGFAFYMLSTLLYFWQLYKDDMEGKDLAFSIKLEWLTSQSAGSIGSLCFLLALFAGITFYAHQYSKFQFDKFNFFPGGHKIVILILAVGGFLYVSFLQPLANYRSMSLLGDIYYMKPGETFKRTENGYRNERMLSLPELLTAKDSLNEVFKKKRGSIIRNIKSNIAESEVDKVVYDLKETQLAIERKEIIEQDVAFSNQKSWECCVKNNIESDILMLQRQVSVNKKFDFAIAEKIAYPLHIFLFYVIGVLFGTLSRKMSVVLPLLAIHFVIFPLWYYAQEFLKKQFLADKINVLTFTFWPLAVAVLLILCQWMVFRKQNVQIDEEALN